MDKSWVSCVVALLVFAALIAPLRVNAETTQGNVVARVVLTSGPLNDWLTPQKYTATVEIMKNGTVPLVKLNATDNSILTGNIIVDVGLTTVVSKLGMTANVNGSAIDSTWDLFGQVMFMNISSNTYGVPLPQDNQWHNAANLTCYYDVPPQLPFPQGDLTKVSLDFNTNIYLEETISNNASTDSNSSLGLGWGITISYYGQHVGYGFSELTVYEKPTPTSTPASTSTPSPTVTPTPTATLTPTQSPTIAPTASPAIEGTIAPEPSPSVPEMSTVALFIAMVAVSSAVILYKRKH